MERVLPETRVSTLLDFPLLMRLHHLRPFSSPDTFRDPPSNHLILPTFKSQSTALTKGRVHRSLFLANSPQKDSGWRMLCW